MIVLRNISKVYGAGASEVVALDDVSLRIDDGEFVAIIGPSGSGKSTLMNILGCLDTPTAGSYELDGVEVAMMTAAELAHIRNEKIGFVFQSFNLLPRVRVLEQVMLPMAYAHPHIDRPRQKQLATEMLNAVGLGDRLTHLPSQLSGGQQQRVAIARALVMHPRVILADEPTGNLDTRTSLEIIGLFEQLHAAGITVIFITHERGIAEHAERTLTVRDGRITSDIHRTGAAAREPVAIG